MRRHAQFQGSTAPRPCFLCWEANITGFQDGFEQATIVPGAHSRSRKDFNQLARLNLPLARRYYVTYLPRPAAQDVVFTQRWYRTQVDVSRALIARAKSQHAENTKISYQKGRYVANRRASWLKYHATFSKATLTEANDEIL